MYSAMEQQHLQPSVTAVDNSTFQLGLCAAADDVKHCLLFCTWTLVSWCKATRFADTGLGQSKSGSTCHLLLISDQ